MPLYAAGKDSPLLTDQMVERHGLTRMWFNQLQMDLLRHKVVHAIEEGGTLFLVSDDGKLHALDAETGQTLWMRTFSQKGMSYLEPAANSRMVAVLDGLELFIFNRKNGKQLFQARLPGAAAHACEMSELYVYVPLLNGRMIAFPLEDFKTQFDDEMPQSPLADDEPRPAGPVAALKEEDPVLANIVEKFAEAKKAIYAEPEAPKPEEDIVLRGPLGIPMTTYAFGTALAKPTVSTQLFAYAPTGRPIAHQEILTWVTDHGSLFAAGIETFSQEDFTLRYMVDSTAEAYFLDMTRIAQREWNKGNEIVARPTTNQSEPPVYRENRSPDLVVPSLVIVGSRGGYVFSVRDRVGEVFWHFAAQGPVVEQIAVIGKDVYCPTFPTGMHAIDITNGQEKWFTPGVKKFVAASKKRLYTLGAHNNLLILNRETGVPVSSFSVRLIDRCLFNLQTDRIFFINDSGLVQCLKERQLCGDPDCRDRVDCPHAAALAAPIRHRLSALQYVDAMKGKKTPKLYWASGDEDEETPDEPKKDSDDSDDDDEDGDPFDR